MYIRAITLVSILALGACTVEIKPELERFKELKKKEFQILDTGKINGNYLVMYSSSKLHRTAKMYISNKRLGNEKMRSGCTFKFDARQTTNALLSEMLPKIFVNSRIMDISGIKHVKVNTDKRFDGHIRIIMGRLKFDGKCLSGSFTQDCKLSVDVNNSFVQILKHGRKSSKYNFNSSSGPIEGTYFLSGCSAAKEGWMSALEKAIKDQVGKLRDYFQEVKTEL